MQFARFSIAAALAFACTATLGALTEAEARWLRAGAEVIQYARGRALPLDVVVQPNEQPGAVPLAMGYVDGRCKLVLSMRGNPGADAALHDTPPTLQPLVMEAIVAHEIGHCWRYARGAWHGLPAGFAPAEGVDPARAEMRATRREEGYADLVALAWTLRQHPARYAEVYTWFERVRALQAVPGSHHDTRAWLRLARDGAAFGPAPDPFEQAQALWREGLTQDD